MRQLITNAELAFPYDWCIAGGFAACPDLASDCDIWIYGVVADSAKVRMNLLKMLDYRRIQFVVEDNNTNEVYAAGNPAGGVEVLKVAHLADGRHILLSSALSIPELLDQFDVSTHQVALTPDGELIRGDAFTPITVPPVQLRDTSTTARRMQKVQQRYALVSVNERSLMEEYPTWLETESTE